MKQCTACKKSYSGLPFWHGGVEAFCSIECLPDGILDEPFGMQYANLWESYRSLEESSTPSSLNERNELLEELDYLITQLEVYNLGDLSGNYYKTALAQLYKTVTTKEKIINSHFTKKEHFHIDFGLHINWEMVHVEESSSVASELQIILKKTLEKHSENPTILYNQELDANTEAQNIIYFQDDVSLLGRGMHPWIEELFNPAIEFLKPRTTSDLEYLCSYIELAKCPICEIMEPWEDFNYKEKEDILACWSC